MPATPDVCRVCGEVYLRRSSLQTAGGPCPRCRARAKALRIYRERRARGACGRCGRMPAECRCAQERREHRHAARGDA